MLKEEIRQKLFEMQDLKYQKFHGALCPNVDNIIGVQVPKLRSIAKEIAKTSAKQYLELEDIYYYEEKVIQGLLIGITKLSIEDTKKYLKKFIPKIDSWAVCDIVCSSLKITNNEQEEMWEFLEKYINSEKEFEIRFALVMYLDYFINENYIDKVINNIKKINSDKYYVQMAIAWLVSVGYVYFPEKTYNLLEKRIFCKFIQNKSISKCRESFRVSKEDKEKLKQLRI